MDNRDYFRSPAQLLSELGITSPEDIDVEAMAFHCGATIRYRPLTGCAARIVGHGDSGIITVDYSSTRGRQRFSAAHELGHWMHDRGKAAFACQEAQFAKEWSALNPESRANRFASALLLPAPLFAPRAQTFKAMDFDTVRKLAETFNTSLTATAIRLAEHGPLPTMLVYYSTEGRVWFARGTGVPDKLWPAEKPGKNTYAFDLLKRRTEHELRGEVPARVWFDHWSSERHTIHEHSLRTRFGDVLTLLWWKNEQMLIDLGEYEERQGGLRSDRRREE